MIRAIVFAAALVFAHVSAARQPLTAPLTLYKYGTAGAPPSSDSNDCTAGHPCTTFARIAEVIRGYDLSSCEPVMVQLSYNNHTDGPNWAGKFHGQCYPRQVEIIGNMANPWATLITPETGDPVSAAFGAEFAIGGLMVRENSSGQSDITVGQYSIVQVLGGVVFLGSGDNANDVSAYLFGTFEAVTPDAQADAFGVKAIGTYEFYENAQCALQAGDHGEIIFDGNGGAGIYTMGMGGPAFSVAFACANNLGMVQIENLTYSGSMSGTPEFTMTGGIIDSGTSGPP